MFGDHFTADRIARTFYRIDQNLRNRFIRRLNLNNENHYTQLYAEYINMAFAGVLPHFVYSSVLLPGHERKFGCDAIIIFQFGTEVKIGLFEAKWPFRNGWDYPQNPNPSHFTNQLERQSKFDSEFAIWETFYDSRKLPNSFILNNTGSMCAWHKETLNFQKASVISRIWTTIDVASLMGQNGLNIYQIIYSILMCKKGKKHNTLGLNSVVVELKDQYSEEIPIPSIYDSDIKENQKILSFVEESGLGLYLAIDLTKFTV